MLTNELGLPQPFVDAATSDHTYTKGRYSVTEVLGGTCEAVLKRRHQGEADEDVADRVWAIFGTAVHKVLQEAEATASQLQEEWLSVPTIEGYSMSGIFDLYDAETETVTDYKTASVWKVQLGSFDDWRTQTLLYCWMLRRLGFEASRGQVVALLRDHSKRDARLKAADGYPPHPVLTVEWEFGQSDFERAEGVVEAWFAEVRAQEGVSDDDLVPCTTEQRWHKPDKWAVMRRGQKRAVKLFDSKDEALGFMDWLANQPSNKGRGLYIEERHGEDTKCEAYCPVAEFCPHGRKQQEAQG